MAWIKTPNDVVVNENAIAEILPPRELGSEFTVEMVMLNGDPSRQDRRELCRGTRIECEAFKADLEAELAIISPVKAKPAETQKPETTKSTTKSTKAAATKEADPDKTSSEA